MTHEFEGLKNDVKHHKKELLITLGTLVLVVIAWLTYKRLAGGGGTAIPAEDTSGVTDTTTPVDSGGGTAASPVAGVIPGGTTVTLAANKQLRNLNLKVKNLNLRVVKTNKILRNIRTANRTEVKQNRHLEQQLSKVTGKHPTQHPKQQAPRKQVHPAQKSIPTHQSTVLPVMYFKPRTKVGSK